MIAIELGLMIGDRSFGTDHPLRGVSTVDDLTDIIANTVTGFDGLTRLTLAQQTDGVLIESPSVSLPEVSVAEAGRVSYDYRLVVSRKLYDRAVGTQMSRSLTNLASSSVAYVNPLDLDGLGVAEGDDVKIVSAKAATILPIWPDSAVPRGILWSPFNQGSGNIEDIIDSRSATTDVRIERV
jgi:NADH-quinone oxidoreductase subunit G